MFDKLISYILSLIMLIGSFGGCITPPEDIDPDSPVEKPDAGTVSVYDVETADYTLDIDASDKLHEISDLLYGIFFEDINFAADGGLYAEMVQNRSFEYTELAAGNEEHAWTDIGNISSDVVKTDKTGRLNENNPSYMVITNASGEKGGIANTGFLEGMAINAGENYKFSVYAKSENYTGKLYIELRSGNDIAASAEINGISPEWTKYSLTLTSSLTSYSNVTLAILTEGGEVCVDMVSLIPENTVFDLRTDLVEALKELEPKFLRFPGGCVIEGHSLELAYDWKDSVGALNGEPYMFNGVYGDVAARKQGQNIWTDEERTDDPFPSYMSYGLGFYEYFLLSEYIGAVGVPVLNCGICCMGRGEYTEYTDLSSDEQAYYIQNMLDLIEFCRGDASTKWGAVRIAMGHAEPFELRYVGIGNEQWGESFYAHYESFVDALINAKAERPEIYEGIELIYSAGVDDGDSANPDYPKSYTNAENRIAEKGIDLSDYAGAIDQHYYNDPGWFLSHTNYYDEENYSRDRVDLDKTRFGGGIPVFVGEYAARSNTWKAGLSEAAYMTGLERNGDIVAMAAYAPLFASITAHHWAPNLIWFNNNKMTKSVNYYAQKVFSINQGKYVLQHKLTNTKAGEAPALQGKIGLGTWRTSANFDDVVITDNATGKVLAKDNFNRFSVGNKWENVADGNWKVIASTLMQKSKETDIDKYNNTGSTMYFGNTDWSDYTFSVKAKKTGGNEGFMLSFAVADTDNCIFWNVGGWWNTRSALQLVQAGSKTEIPQTSKDIEIIKNKVYDLKVTVSGRNVKCYIDGELYVDYDVPVSTVSDLYSVVSTDDTGDTIIKLVNVSGEVQTVAINIAGTDTVNSVAKLYEVKGSSPENDNYLWAEEAVTMTEGELTGLSSQFNYSVPAYSVIVMRLAG